MKSWGEGDDDNDGAYEPGRDMLLRPPVRGAKAPAKAGRRLHRRAALL